MPQNLWPRAKANLSKNIPSLSVDARLYPGKLHRRLPPYQVPKLTEAFANASLTPSPDARLVLAFSSF